MLQAWLEQVYSLFDDELRKIIDLRKLRNALEIRTQYDEVYTYRLGAEVESSGAIEQLGSDGTVLTVGTFQASTGQFTQSDIGKSLEISGSTASSINNSTFQIAAVVNNTTVVVDPATELDAGPLKWVLRASETTGEATRTYRVESGDLSPIAQGFRLSDGRSSYVVVTRTQFRLDSSLPEVERIGTDASIEEPNILVVPRAVFSRQDLDKPVSITNSSTDTNEGLYRIDRVIGYDAVANEDRVRVRALDGSVVSLSNDLTGTVEWAVRCLPQVELVTPQRLDGVVFQEGVDGVITAPDTLSAVTARFTADDIGRLMRIANSDQDPTNDGFYEILTVVDENTVTLDATLTAETTSGEIVWSVRAPTALDDASAVTIRAPSLLTDYAQDYGLTIDLQEVERRQRNWIHGMTRWIDRKGVADSYTSVGAVSGFEVEAEQLYKITKAVANAIPNSNVFEIGEATVGRFGEDGSLFAATSVEAASPVTGKSGTDGNITAPDTFTTTSAIFTASDVGRSIRFSNTAVGTNADLFEIASVVNNDTITVTAPTLLTDAANGNITWQVIDVVAGTNVFSSPTAVFEGKDVGRYLRIELATTLANNDLFEIKRVLDANTIELVETITTDANNGSLEWRIVQLFTNLAPLRPRFDEIRADLLERVVESESAGALEFRVDKYCWEDNFSTTVPIEIVSATFISGTTYQLELADGGTGLPAIGFITVPPPSQIVDTETFTISDGANPAVVFEFDDNGASTPGNVRVNIAGLTTAEEVRDRIVAAINAHNALGSFNVVAVADGLDVLRLRNTVNGAVGNVAITDTVVDTGFSTLGMQGGAAAVAEMPTVARLPGRWKLTDANGVEFYLETVPDLTAPYNVTVLSATTPTVGTGATLEYVCAPIFSCDYCSASVVRLVITFGDVLDDGATALERAQDRVLRRIADEICPAHVRCVPVFRRVFQATWDITACIDPGAGVGQTLYAPFNAYYDEIPGDEIPADSALIYAVVITP